ncbi:S8 family serine peptidase, partial [Austwickia sp. TVS 96-490-7B]|uniref:S8 family peptidase n=1 Tax=Austwickia sp. TVS 96-490-7B TaxID=2830843 RepID=UPI001C58BDC7
MSQGEGVKVCVVDSGVDPTHPDLRDVTFAGGKDMSGGGTPDGLKPYKDYRGAHGTGMAAYISGTGHGPGKSAGIIGAAPKATLISVSWGDDIRRDPIPEAVKYCAEAGAKVINLSIGGSGKQLESAVALAESKDVVLVAAVGNDGKKIHAGWSRVFGTLLVGGVTENLQRHELSTWGEPKRNELKGVYSQGVGVCGPFATSSRPEVKVPQAVPGGGYEDEMGTSVATAVVTGVVAAVRAKYPEMDAANVINRVIKTAKKSGSGPVPTPDCGWGVVDAAAALTADVPKVDSNPLGQMDDKAFNSHREIFGVKSMGLWDPSYKPDAQSPARPSGSPAMSAEPAGGASVGLIVGVVGVGSALVGGVYWWLRRRQ